MEIVIPEVKWAVLTPMLAVVLTALAVLVVDLFTPKERRTALAALSLLGLLVAFALCLQLWGREDRAFREMVALDRFTLFFDLLFILITFFAILISTRYLVREGAHHGEYYTLLLTASVGAMIMASSLDLIVLFLGLETFSISLFVLAGFLRKRLSSNESALKYLLLGAFATSFFLYGIAFIYGSTGTTHLPRIAEALGGGRIEDPLLFIGVGLLLVGLGFKVAAVPFHTWLPDVYEGAPTPVTAFMIAGTKAAAFAAFLRVFPFALSPLRADWAGILWLLSILTMTVGNVVALAQRSVKRMLVYSSIAHAGYLLVALTAGGESGAAGILFYLLAYAFMNLGAFGVLIALTRKGEESFDFSEYAGAGFRHPLLSLSMAVFMISLAGFPPTSGFVGKFYIFAAAVEQGYTGLAIIGVLNSVISVYFYLRVIVVMYMSEASPDASLTLSPALTFAVLVSVLMTLWLGLFPRRFLTLARLSILALMR